MRKISVDEKKLVIGGASAGRRNFPCSSSKSKVSSWNARFHNTSLLALSTIPGLITLMEEIYSFFSGGKHNINQVSSYNPTFSGYSNSNLSSRRDFYAYASEALRPTIRFSPYYYKSGITFGVPWAV